MNSMRFIKIIKELLSYFYQFRISGSLVIDPDANGYCQSVIEEICNVADLYRGYKRKGKIFLTKQDRDQKEEKQKEEKSHWNFWGAGEYQVLKVKDPVGFKSKSIKQKNFSIRAILEIFI